MEIIKDKYRRVRGGTSVIYKITCAECGEYLCHYQKDGGGALRRLYIDRILETSLLIGGVCPCGNWFGTPYIYKLENRPAIRLRPGAIKKSKHLTFVEPPIKVVEEPEVNESTPKERWDRITKL